MNQRQCMILSFFYCSLVYPGANAEDPLGQFLVDLITTILTFLCALPLVGEPFCRLLPTDGNTEDGMNVVFFYADDWTFRNVGLVNGIVKTPHLDSMAANGVMFRYNCVTTSICWISRATMMTGQYAAVHQQLKVSDTGMFDHWNETLYPKLRSADYNVGFVGKWYVRL